MIKPNSINLNRLAIFVAVAETGSFTRAASKLGIANTMSSTHVRQLEAELGVALFVRTTRKVVLTDAGRTFYAASRKILHEFDDAVASVRDDTARPQGTLFVTAPIDYGSAVITPLLVGLQRQYPALQVNLLCADSRSDLVAEGIDVAIRLGQLADSTHRAVRVGGYTKWLVASPKFLEHHGTPKSLADVGSLPFVSLSVLAQPLLYDFEGSDKRKERVVFNESFSANTAHSCRAAALVGGGLAVLTDFSVREDVAEGRLVRVLPDWSLPKSDIHAVFPATSHMPIRVRVFIDEIMKYAAATAHHPG